MSIIIALLIFSGIILFHEFGHFLAAKRSGITVLEFSLGMGPRVLSTVRGETRYSLKLFPIGGSCQMLGEDAEEAGKGSFSEKPAWIRILVVAAGPLFNFLLAWLLSVILIACVGTDLPDILSVSEGYPASEAGMEAGDRVVSLDGKRIHLYREVSDYISEHQESLKEGRALRVVWLHEKEKREAMISAADDGNGRYIIGISGSPAYRTKLNLWQTLEYGIFETGYWIHSTVSGLRMMITGQAGVEDLSGPVGVVDVISETYEESRSDGAYYVFLNMVNIAILLSANLGVINLLPIPALDGGRLIFLLLELVRRKKISPEKEGMVHFAGFVLLIALMIFVLFQDVHRVIG